VKAGEKGRKISSKSCVATCNREKRPECGVAGKLLQKRTRPETLKTTVTKEEERPKINLVVEIKMVPVRGRGFV